MKVRLVEDVGVAQLRRNASLSRLAKLAGLVLAVRRLRLNWRQVLVKHFYKVLGLQDVILATLSVVNSRLRPRLQTSLTRGVARSPDLGVPPFRLPPELAIFVFSDNHSASAVVLGHVGYGEFVIKSERLILDLTFSIGRS